MTDKYIQLKDADNNNLFPASDYNNSVNHPSINGVPLLGNKTLDELGILARNKKLLWSNPAPDSAFTGQTVTLTDNADNYDMLIFVSSYQGKTTTKSHSDCVMSGMSFGTIVTYKDSTTASNTDTTLAWRNVQVAGASVTINNAMYNSASGGGYNRNDLCIPVYIYGVNFGGVGSRNEEGASGIVTLWTRTGTDGVSTATYTLSDTADFYIIKSRYRNDGTDTSLCNSYCVAMNGVRVSTDVYATDGRFVEMRSYMIDGTTFNVYQGYEHDGDGASTSLSNYCVPIAVYGVYVRQTIVNNYNYTYTLPSINNSNLTDLIYPIGSIYASTSSANPGSIFGGTWEALSRNNYATVQFPSSTTSYSATADASTTLTVTTNGNPVFLIFTGDINPTSATSAWGYVSIRRGSTTLANHIVQTPAASSVNNTFAVQYIDSVEAGTYTYTFYFDGQGSGAYSLNEMGTNPWTCTAFEIGADPSLYKWKRTA